MRILGFSLILCLVIRLGNTVFQAQISTELTAPPAVTFSEALSAWFWLIVWFLFSIASFEFAIEASGYSSYSSNNCRFRIQRQAVLLCGSLGMVCASYLLPNAAVQLAIDNGTETVTADIFVAVTVFAGILALAVAGALSGAHLVLRVVRGSRQANRTRQ